MPGEDDPARMLSDEEQALVVGDTEEQRRQDERVVRLYQEAHNISYDPGAEAERALAKLMGTARGETNAS